MASKPVVVVILCLFLCFPAENLALEPGERCTYSTGVSGVCRMIFECQQAIKDLKAGKKSVLCKTGSIVQVVCCPDDVPATTAAPVTQSRVDISRLRLIDQKCHEYQEYVYENVSLPVLIPGAVPLTSKQDRCGFKVVPLIVGGTAAKSREFPHMARLGYGPNGSIKWSCGGTIISRRFILTAGHCTATRDGPPTFVRIGDLVWNQSDDDAQPQEIAVDSVISHPDYSTRLQYNDISLLKLVRQMDFGFYARPACVNTQYQYSQHMAIATGWGLTEYFGSDSDVLQKVTLDFFTFDECTGRFPSNRKLPQGLFQDQQLCAGSKDESKDTCEGDSGGPLQVYHEVHCMYKVVGITSFGKGCGNAGTPGVYTRVSKYVDWIEQNAFTDG